MSAYLSTCTEPPSWFFLVLKYCTWKDRIQILQLSRSWSQSSVLAGPSSYFWQWCCETLADSDGLYLPLEDMDLLKETWRDEFLRNWAKRNAWTASRDVTPQPINVAVRFRAAAPKTDDGKEEDEENDQNSENIVLPLHQRLQLIKMTTGAKTTSEAMRVLMGAHAKRDPFDALDEEEDAKLEVQADTADGVEPEDGDTTAGSPSAQQEATAAAATTTTTGSHLDVIQSSYKASVLSVDEAECKVLAVAPGVGLKQFQFDQVYSPTVEQKAVYNRSARKIVADFINGYNGSIIVYGQTGSGKTYTMFGEQGAPGLVPRACAEIFQALEQRQRLGIDYEIAVSYVEVFGQEVIDLLRDGQAVGQSRVAGQRYVIDGRAQVPVHGLGDVEELLERGHEMKRRAATAMNERSSRAHALFILHLKQVREAKGLSMSSTLILADLGGSEKVKKSEVNAMVLAAGFHPWRVYYDSRRRLQEAMNINAGLLALKKCIAALNAQREVPDGVQKVHVPYNDSKLTTLLSTSLGGDSKTLVLVTASLDHRHSIETVQSLRFGEECANIETSAAASVSALSSMILKLDAEIHEVEEQIRVNERWETRKVVRHDLEGDEVMMVTIPVGAETERERLEELLKMRRELFGTT